MELKKSFLPYLSVALAILISTLMDFNGLTVFSALPLLLLSLTFLWVSKLGFRKIGLRWGKLKYYLLALLHPALAIGFALTIAKIGDYQIDTEALGKQDYKVLLINLGIAPLLVLLTEEGFFRGWLWLGFNKAGLSWKRTLLLTSVLFTLWHVSAVTADTSYGLPLENIPIYLINALMLGMIWGLMRFLSGSLLLPSVAHALWNALIYFLFGFGEQSGALGLSSTLIFGPEVGVLGLVVNGLFLYWLWTKALKQKKV